MFRLFLILFLFINGVLFPEEAIFEEGKASYYGEQFHGRMTASGETFNKNEYTAAHRTLKFNSLVKVTNVKSGKSIIVRVNDRGPHVKGRIIDLSEIAFKKISDSSKEGTVQVKLEIIHANKDDDEVVDDDFDFMYDDTTTSNNSNTTKKENLNNTEKPITTNIEPNPKKEPVIISNQTPEKKNEPKEVVIPKNEPKEIIPKDTISKNETQAEIENNIPNSTRSTIVPNTELAEEPFNLSNSTYPPTATYKLSGDKVELVGYSIQVDAFNFLDNAVHRIRELQLLKIRNIFIETVIMDGVALYRVLIGTYETREEAILDITKLKDKGFHGFVKTH